MFKRLKPLVIHGRTITDPLAVELAPFVTEERALFVAELRVQRGSTWRSVAEECGKPWGSRQDIGAALSGLASTHPGEDGSDPDSL